MTQPNFIKLAKQRDAQAIADISRYNQLPKAIARSYCSLVRLSAFSFDWMTTQTVAGLANKYYSET